MISSIRDATLATANLSPLECRLAAVPAPESDASRPVPRYAWDWLQRSRPIVRRLAETLTGRPPPAGFVDAVRRSYDTDPLVRDAVHGAIADVAFRGRVPPRRPPGASWDRGLVWWAAVLTGCPPDRYAAPAPPVDQPALFDPATGTASPTVDRAVVVAALSEVLARADGEQVPAVAIAQLIARLERGAAPGRSRPVA